MRWWWTLLLVGEMVAWTPPQNSARACSRRHWIAEVLITGCASLGGVPACDARDDLFQANPLTNPLLEQIRIWDQAQADEIRYGGELTPGDAGNRGKTDGYVNLLVPILQVDSDLVQVNAAVRDRNQWNTANEILAAPTYDKVAFKKIFNAFGDNIYYSDPDRANLYLGGGATPRNEQSIAYLLRNEILTTVEALRAELDYMLQNAPADEDDSDLIGYARHASAIMQQYLDLVPPDQLKSAREILAGSQS